MKPQMNEAHERPTSILTFISLKLDGDTFSTSLSSEQSYDGVQVVQTGSSLRVKS